MKKAGCFSAVVAYILIIGFFLVGALAGSRATSVVAQRIPMERDSCIVIDAGHGGVDGGATSCTGILESRFNLDISLRLRDLFHLIGYQTAMVRTSDISVYTTGDTIGAQKVSDLRQRVRLVIETPNAILLSIHQNTFHDSRYSGAQVFYGISGESEAFAKAIQNQFIETLNPGSKRTAKKGEGIYLLQHITCTGALIECGFLSNPSEEANLRDPEYQKRICCVIASATAQFLTK